MRKLVEGASSIYTAALVVMGVYCVKAVTLVVPASLVYISVGMAFPTPVALLINCLGIMAESTITYFMGKFLGGDRVDKMLRDKKGYEKLEKFRDKGKYPFVFLLRFASFPIDLGSLFFGASSFPLLTYLTMYLEGTLPRVIVLTVLGEKAYELIPMKYIVTAVFIALPVAALGFVIYKFVILPRKKKTEEAEEREENVEK